MQVVSILDVMIKLGERVFQSREVRGAVCSGDLEFDSSASGVSLWVVAMGLGDRAFMELLWL